jgi:AraC-like DNA-binding protein
MAVSIHRSQLSATTEEAARELLQRMRVRAELVAAGTSATGRFTLGEAAAGDLSAIRAVNVGMRLELLVDPIPGQFAAATFLGGRISLACGRRDERSRAAGESYLCASDQPLRVTWDNFDVIGLRLPMAELRHAAPGLVELNDAVPLRFCGTDPISARRAALWRAVALMAYRELWAADSMLANPLVRREMVDTVVAAALTTFPNTAMTCGYVPGPGAVRPRAVRRAVAFIDANASLPITVADIADAAGTSASAIRAAFRRHLDTTPSALLRRVRLEAARRDLAESDPTGAVSVADIGARWGYRRLDRFAAAYQESFGVPPERTLQG